MGQCTSTNGEDMVGPAGVGMGMAMARAKAADLALGQRKSGSNNSSRGRAAATGVEHHPASRNAPVALAPANGVADKRSGSGNGGAVRAGSSLSSDANSKHVQRLLQSLSLLQALPSLYPWYIAQPALQPALLSICQARWQSIRLGAHELYATVRSADPASSPTLVFFQLFSSDLLARCPELHIHLFGSAPLTPRTKPSLSAKLCSLVQTTIASFAFSTSSRRKHTSKNRVSSQFDSVSECSELEPSTSGNANAYAADRDQPQPQAASAAERKQRMASLWRQFNNAGINCEALGPFFTSLQNALAQCFGVNEWRGNTQLAWNTLCSTVIEQLIGVESTGAGAPTLVSAPSNGGVGGDGNGNGGGHHLTVDKMDKTDGPLSLMSSPRSHTGSQTMGDTTDTVSRTGHSAHHSAHHSQKPSNGSSANAMALKPAAYKQRLDLQSTASRVSRSGYTQSSDVYSPRRSERERSPTAHNKTLQLNGLSLPSTQLQLQLQLNSASQLPANALSLSVASPFSSSGQPSQSASATPVRRMPSALAQAAGAANPTSGGHGSVQSMSLGLSPLIQLPGQTPSPTTPAQAAAPAPGTAGGSRQGSRHGSRQVTRDDYDDEPCECGAADCKRCEAQADADADGDDAFDALPQQPLDAETLRALRETASLDPAQELARFAFHPKPPAKPKVVYMSGLELPPALLAADPATAALVAAADRRAAVYGRSLFGLSRVQPSVQATTAAYEMTALALLTAPQQYQHFAFAAPTQMQLQMQMSSASSSSRAIGAASAAHTHNHTLSRNHSQSRGHSNSRSAAPASVAASNVPLPLSLSSSSASSDASASANLSLVSRTTTGVGAGAGAGVNANAHSGVGSSAGGVGARSANGSAVSSSTSSNLSSNSNANPNALLPLPPIVSVSA